ncbi:AraC family transcriptional regulator ligand-binding domain-containing protein [Marinomonas sp. 15G1-11]|uniref:AraC family transcriptional regulator ligand-binding domain-containing protein n=1 Tax=Marinomonas phaeophyticola TaxID=3004091 RepID=A0ABT4JVF6_9GAMM|nr:AraC family transcriptional regulator [Marinomonas sp. 15G1-11]MCZ2722236.1 AraC family transcriptional regulator ligand-binding domain-containing protein [Marinomonas sp. 15G1-11]
MNLKAFVPMSSVRFLLKALEDQGVDSGALLSSLEISKEDIEFGSSFPAHKYGLLYQHIMFLVQDESFGMLSGGKIPNGTFRMMCLCIIHARSLAHSLYRCSDFYEICRGPIIKPVLIKKGRYAMVTFAPLDSASEEDVEALMNTESQDRLRTTLSMWHHFISWLIGRRLSLKAAYFTCERPDDLDYYKTLFQSEVKFNQHANALVFPSSYLDLPVVQTEESLRGFLKTAPYQLLVMVDNDNSLKSQVMSMLGKDFSRDVLSADEVASALNMSVSTLRRRLNEEKTSYQQIKDECRKEAAITYMNAPQLSISDIAQLMGFDEPSAFFRSFKKWTGVTPGEYRKNEEYLKFEKGFKEVSKG